MKKNIKYLIIALVLVVGLTLVACASIDSIFFEKQPRTLYVQGQDLDFNDTVLMAVSGDKNTPVDINGGEVTISGYDKNVVGEQAVTFTYKEKSTTLKITVIPRIAVEGASTKYFVGDVFDKTKGRLRVADDLGNITTVNMADEGVTIVDFDSSKAESGKLVTVKYGEYTGTFPVEIYDVTDVKLSGVPKISAYKSHDTEFNVTGGFFTVTAKNNEYEKYVELTADMVSGFDPGAATPEHMETPLKQTVKLNYLTFSFDFEVTIRYSAVTLMNVRAEELANVTDVESLSEEQGKLAWEAISAYFNLAPAEKKLLTKEVKDRVARFATVYGYELFLKELETYKDTFTLVKQEGVILNDEEEEVEKTLGAFSFVAKSYESTKKDVERLKDDDEPFVVLAEVLTKLEDEFDHVMITDEKDMEDYVELLFTPDARTTVIPIFEMMLTLYEEFESIPDDWKAEDLVRYRSEIKRVVVTIRNSELNPYHVPAYNVLYDLMSQWRTNHDYFEIIFTYYLENERDVLIAELWEAVPFPGTLMSLYSNIAYGLYETMNMRVGKDTTQFMYYYKHALEDAAKIKEENDPLMMDIYRLFDFDKIIDQYFFIGNAVDGFAYIYHVSSLFGNKNFETLMGKYLQIMEDLNTGKFSFEVAEDRERVRELVDMYYDFTPAEQYAFLSALHCEYRYNTLSDFILGYTIKDDGTMSAYSWFGYMVFNSYNEMLSAKGFDVFANLMVASEVYALRYRDDAYMAAFTAYMEEIIEMSSSMTDEDRAIIGDILDTYTQYYEESKNPTTPDVSKYQDKLDELYAAMDAFYEFNALLNDSSIENPGEKGYYALFFSTYMKARTLMDELIATGDADLIKVLESTLVEFDTDKLPNGAKDVTYSYDFMLQEMANIYYSVLYKANISGTNADGEEFSVNAFYLYYDSGLPAFMATVFDVAWAQYKDKAAELDPQEVLAVMEEYRQLTPNAYYVYRATKCHLFYMDAVKACFASTLSEEAMAVLELLLDAEDAYAGYVYEKHETQLASFVEAMEALIDARTKLADKSEIADFEAMYMHYLALYNELR